MIEDVPLSPVQEIQQWMQFRATRKPYWDRLDQHIFTKGFDRHWPALSQQEKQDCLAKSLVDLLLVERMLPSVQAVPDSALFDLMMATRHDRPHWDADQEKRWLDIARQFLEKGADPNHVGEDPLGIGPFSVLEKCASCGYREEPLERTLLWMNLVMDAGADPSLKGHPEHGPPLELALRWETPEGVLLLLERGADPAAATLVDRRQPAVAAAFNAWVKSRRLEKGLPKPSLTLAQSRRF